MPFSNQQTTPACCTIGTDNVYALVALKVRMDALQVPIDYDIAWEGATGLLYDEHALQWAKAFFFGEFFTASKRKDKYRYFVIYDNLCSRAAHQPFIVQCFRFLQETLAKAHYVYDLIGARRR